MVQPGRPFAWAACAVITVGCGGSTGPVLIVSFGVTRRRPLPAASDGNLVLNDPGQTRVALDVEYNGTPGDPSDDVEVPDSFRVVRASTGNSDLPNRDFCADLLEFTG